MANVGDSLPELVLTGNQSGFEVQAHAPGTKLLLICHGTKTQDAPKVVGKGIRETRPDADDLLVVNVVNLQKMGGMWKKVAGAQIKSTYERLAAKIGEEAPKYVIMHTDWDNEVAPALGFADTESAPGFLLADEAGTVLAVHEGLEGALDAIRSAL